MTSSDSTPDFSWLNEKEKAAEAKKQVSAETDEVESLAQENSEVNADHLGDETDSSSATDLVNPTAETWIADSPVFENPFQPKSPADFVEQPEENSGVAASEEFTDEEGSSESSASEESHSVFDEEVEDSTISASADIEPTLIMPGRQLTETDNALLNTSAQPEDATVVLPPKEAMAGASQQPELFSTTEEKTNHEEEADLNSESQIEESSLTSEPTDENEGPEGSQDETSDSPTEAKATKPASASAAPSEAAVESKMGTGTILLLSYASAMTLVVLFLLLKGGSGSKNDHLESLPDVAPEPAGELSYVPVKAGLPAGHVLKVGEKQRFGNIEIEPLRIVQEPIIFSHYDPTSKLTRPPTQPVYKLWLKFTNVSKNQEIAPLDGNLLLRWVTNSAQQREYSNQYIFADGASNSSEEISTYRHSKTSDWDLNNQKLGQVLEPGESYETYIASTEDLPVDLPEHLNWRVQFRKGLSPNGGGVTTVVDVAFKKSEVKPSDQSI